MDKEVGPRLRELAPADRGNHGRGITQPRTSLFNIPVQKPGLFSGASSKGFRVSCHEERTGDQGNWAKEASLDFIPTIEVSAHMNDGLPQSVGLLEKCCQHFFTT